MMFNLESSPLASIQTRLSVILELDALTCGITLWQAPISINLQQQQIFSLYYLE